MAAQVLTRIAPWLGVMVGCGRWHFDATPDTDAEMSTMPCQQWSPFSPPERLALVSSTSDDWGPFISFDNLELVFHSYRTDGIGSADLWTASRQGPELDFAGPALLADLDTPQRETSPLLSEDGRALYFSSDGLPGGMGGEDVWVATRSGPGAPFGAPANVSDLSTPGNERLGFVSADGLRAYLARDANGGDLFVAMRSDLASPFGSATALTELNDSTFADEGPGLSWDELEIFFHSDRSGSTGMDLWRATRADVSQPFSSPDRVVELSSARDDTGASLSRDSATLYFTYDALISGGGADIWRATRTCLAR